MATMLEKSMKKQMAGMKDDMPKKMSKKEKVKAIIRKNKKMRY